MSTTHRILQVSATGLVLALSLSMGAWTMAQHQGRGHMPGGGGADHGMMLRQIISSLGLSEDQKTAVHEGLLARHEALGPLMDSLQEARAAVGQAIHAPEFDEIAIRDAAAAVGRMEADLAVGRAEMLHELRAILTPEQQESLETILGAVMTEHGAHSMGHGSLRQRHGGDDGGGESSLR